MAPIQALLRGAGIAARTLPFVLLVGCSGGDEEPAQVTETFCGRVGGGPGAAPAMTTSIDADDAAILYTGRMDFSDAKAPVFSAPAAYATVRFEGTAVSVKLEDEFLYGRRNYFDVIVDPGSECERRVKIAPKPGETEYPAIWGLEPGEHTAVFVKRTESSIGKVTFGGFSFRGDVLEAPERPARKVQIIGDSISCGVGADVPPKEEREPGVTFDQLCDEDTWGVPYHNAYKAFGTLAARHFGAEFQLATVSGIGLVRNYSSNPDYDLRPLPEVYDSVFLQDMDSPAWDPKEFVPDLVIVALGTNDFSPGEGGAANPRDPLDVDEYIATYIEFVDKLRSDAYYPDAKFLLLGSPLLSDGWPDATNTYRTDLHTTIAAVEEHYASMGIDSVRSMQIDKVTKQGCDGHPSGDEHEQMAGLQEWLNGDEPRPQVIPMVSELTGWE